MPLPKRVEERLISAVKRFVPILHQQKTRDVSEADTVTLVKDILCDAFGYDKYAEITGEFAIRGTYCDLVLKSDGKLTQMVEVKAIGANLDERHVKQAVDYSSNQGVDWAILTNGIIWRLYQVIFAKPIDKRLLTEIDLTTLNLKDDSHLELLYLFTILSGPFQ